MEFTYLVRYGIMGHYGRFLADSDAFDRGQTVVIRSCRGTELGEVVMRVANATEASPPPQPTPARILRLAALDDRERAREAERDRPSRLAACEGVLGDGAWPIEMIDVEPLLDDRRTVLLYLGAHRLDANDLLTTFRERGGLDVVLEPVGIDATDHHESGCGSCGSGGGCSGCAVKELMSSRRAAPARV